VNFGLAKLDTSDIRLWCIMVLFWHSILRYQPITKADQL